MLRKNSLGATLELMACHSNESQDCVGCKRCETACPTDFLSIRVESRIRFSESRGVYLQENEETQYSLGLDLAVGSSEWL